MLNKHISDKGDELQYIYCEIIAIYLYSILLLFIRQCLKLRITMKEIEILYLKFKWNSLLSSKFGFDIFRTVAIFITY